MILESYKYGLGLENISFPKLNIYVTDNIKNKELYACILSSTNKKYIPINTMLPSPPINDIIRHI